MEANNATIRSINTHSPHLNIAFICMQYVSPIVDIEGDNASMKP
jgi:hypothetical protein